MYGTLAEMANYDGWTLGGAAVQNGRAAEGAAVQNGRAMRGSIGQNGKALDRWLSSFDTVTQDAICVLAPSLCGFVVWALRRAMEEGRGRLYFVARDGYLMYRLAQILCRTLGLPVKCRYLYYSRYSLRIPAFHLDMEGALDFICRGGIDVTMEKILNRSGIGGKDKRKVLRMLRLPYAGDEVIPYARLKEVRRRLGECEYFLACVERNSRRRMPELAGYLRQEGLLDGANAETAGDAPHVGERGGGEQDERPAVEEAGPAKAASTDGSDYALVDSGWTGSMQKTLGEVLMHLGRKEPLKGYYFGLYELPKGVERDDYAAYYFGPKDGLRAKVHFSNCLFESVFSAPHGMTVGYQRSRDGEGRETRRGLGTEQGYGTRQGQAPGQTYVPILAECLEERCRFAKLMELCVTVYGEKLANNIKACAKDRNGARMGDKNELREAFLGLDVHEFRDVTRRLFKAFMGSPTRVEAETFGDLKFSDDVLENALYRTAAKLTEEELVKNHVWNKALVMLGIRKGLVKESAWYEGSVARLGRRNGYHWRMYAAYKYLLYVRQAGWKRR